MMQHFNAGLRVVLLALKEGVLCISYDLGSEDGGNTVVVQKSSEDSELIRMFRGNDCQACHGACDATHEEGGDQETEWQHEANEDSLIVV